MLGIRGSMIAFMRHLNNLREVYNSNLEAHEHNFGKRPLPTGDLLAALKYLSRAVDILDAEVQKLRLEVDQIKRENHRQLR